MIFLGWGLAKKISHLPFVYQTKIAQF